MLFSAISITDHKYSYTNEVTPVFFFYQAKEISLADLQENYIEALNKLVSENQQLQKDLMDTKSQLEISTQMCKKNHDRIFKPTHSRIPVFK